MKIQHLLLVTAIFLHSCQACMDITDYLGTLDSTTEIMTYLDTATSCHCCALCHQNTGCKSLSFDTVAHQCKLYNKVGSYAEFSRQRKAEHTTQFFFMPRSSQTDEFCRSDDDCVVDGDVCRGRVCTSATSDTTVTCRDLYQLNSALPDHRYWGVLDGREQVLYCRMEAGFEGATLLLAFQHDAAVPWSYENLQHRSEGSPDEEKNYSILKHADMIRNRQTSPQYRVWIIAKENGGNAEFKQNFTADRDLGLIGTERVLLSSGRYTATPEVMYDDRYLVFPHITADCNAIYSTGHYDCNNRRSVVRTDGKPWWPTGMMERNSIVMYITE